MIVTNPDWNRAMVRPPGGNKPVGDPQLWGASAGTAVDIQAVSTTGVVTVDTNPRVIQGAQLIQTKTQDAYSRSWSVCGTLAMPLAGWETASADLTAPINPEPAARDDVVNVWLEISQGVGHANMTQLVLLTSGATAQSRGIVQQQTTINNGPYGETVFVPVSPPSYNGLINLNAFAYRMRSFAMIGALVGNQISIRTIVTRGNQASLGAPVIPMVVVTVALTPYAPGSGI